MAITQVEIRTEYFAHKTSIATEQIEHRDREQRSAAVKHPV